MDNKADKLLKKQIRHQQKRIKPGECQKYVRLILDSGILGTSFGQELLSSLNYSELKYDIRKLPAQYCIAWERSVGQRVLASSATGVPGTEEISLDNEWQMENQIVRFISAEDMQQAIKDGTVKSIGERLHDVFPKMHHTLVVIDTKDKNSKSSAMATALIELHVLQQVNALQVRNVKELVALMQRFTKSVAEAPYKQQKSETLDGFKKYLANDKNQCVRVVGRNGLGRLWQQHLNRLPMVTLEVAETIKEQYSCPKKLLLEFERNPDAISGLADLKIRRGGPQPQQTDRRIGNVLSAKMHALYHARDGNTLV